MRAVAVGLLVEEQRSDVAAAWKRAVEDELGGEPALAFAVGPLLREMGLALRDDRPRAAAAPAAPRGRAPLRRARPLRAPPPARVAREFKLLHRALWSTLRAAGRIVGADERRAADEWLDEALAAALDRLDRVRMRIDLLERGPAVVRAGRAPALSQRPPPLPRERAAQRPPPLPAARSPRRVTPRAPRPRRAATLSPLPRRGASGNPAPRAPPRRRGAAAGARSGTPPIFATGVRTARGVGVPAGRAPDRATSRQARADLPSRPDENRASEPDVGGRSLWSHAWVSVGARTHFTPSHALSVEMRSVGLSFRWRNPERRSRPVTARPALLAAVLSLVPLAAACGGGARPARLDAAACSRERRRRGSAGGGSRRRERGAFQGDGSKMPSWGGWAWGNVPAEAVARAGFDWFETGYPGDTRTNEILASGGVRPFAYINLGELHDDLRRRLRLQRPDPAHERATGGRTSST